MAVVIEGINGDFGQRSQDSRALPTSCGGNPQSGSLVTVRLSDWWKVIRNVFGRHV